VDRRQRQMCIRDSYNIISNVDMKDHHFQPPDKRPEPTEQEVSLLTS
jgi:hypothetical protein